MEFIECECKSLGDYAVALPPNYGWTIPGPISCAFVVVSACCRSHYLTLIYLSIVNSFAAGDDSHHSSSCILLQANSAWD